MQHTLESLVRAKKNPGLIAAPSTDSVSRAVHLMNARGVGAVLITENDQLVGIFTERDLLRRVLEGRHDPATTPVSAVMTSPIRCASSAMTVGAAIRAMTKGRHRHLPVVEQSVVVGIVSMGDLMHHMSRKLGETVSDLSTYICGPAVIQVPYAPTGASMTPDRSPRCDAASFDGVLKFDPPRPGPAASI